jgi:hypothetical protein
MDFGVLPPEINSGRMYTGPGAGPMLLAAAAWDGLAAQLHSTAASYSSVISGLTAGWQGPSSETMAAAAAPYVAWMRATATQAEQAATQARAAAAAYETAFAATVPPPFVAANRALLMSLVATNFLGQNTPAIAATELHYAEMWAQDAAAMYAYVGSSATASQVTPFTEPPQTTNPTGAGGQAAAVAQATGTAAGGHAHTLSQLMSAMPRSLQSLTLPAASAAPPAPRRLIRPRCCRYLAASPGHSRRWRWSILLSAVICSARSLTGWPRSRARWPNSPSRCRHCHRPAAQDCCRVGWLRARVWSAHRPGYRGILATPVRWGGCRCHRVGPRPPRPSSRWPRCCRNWVWAPTPRPSSPQITRAACSATWPCQVWLDAPWPARAAPLRAAAVLTRGARPLPSSS